MFKRYVFQEGLTSLLGSNGSVLINTLGQIKDKYGNDLPYHRDGDGHKVINCQAWGGLRDYRIIDLVAIQFKSLCIPLEKYGEICAFTIDNNHDNLKASNIGYRFKSGLLEYEKREGFFYVPGFPMLAINRNGVAVNVRTNQLKNFFISKQRPERNIKGGYRISVLTFSKKRTVSFSRHRLLCLTFKEFPNNVDDLEVNHINGAPGDDRLENLEWVNRSENLTHAYKSGLKTQNYPVKIRFLKTGEVVEYYSVSEAARVLGLDDESMRCRIVRSKFGTVFRDWTQVKYSNDDRDWVDFSDVYSEVKKSLQHVAIKVRDCWTGEVTEYSTATDAGKATGVNMSTILYRLNERNHSPLFGFQFMEKGDASEFPEFTEKEYRDSLTPNSFGVNLRNHLTGEEASFSSVRKAERFMASLGLSQYFNFESQPLMDCGWQAKLAKDKWRDIEDLDRELYLRNKTVMFRDEVTGELGIEKSTKQAAKKLGLDSSRVKEAALSRGNTLYMGYRFRLGVSNDPWPQ